MAQSRTVNTIKNSFAALFLQFVSIIARFVTQSVFIYTLGKEYTGVAGVFSDILYMFSATELGIGTAVLFNLYKLVLEKNYPKISAYVNTLRKVYRIIALAIIAIGGLLLTVLDYIIKDVPNIKEDIRLIFVLFVIKSAVSYLFMYRSILFEACQQKRVTSMISAGMAIVTTATQVVVLIMTHEYILFLLLDICGLIIRNIIIAFVFEKRFAARIDRRERLDKEENRELWGNVGTLSIYNLSTIILNGTDSVIISSIFGTATVGLLAGYRMLSNYLATFAGQFFHSALPSLGNATVAEDSERNYIIYKRLSFALFAITSITTVCLFVLLTPFIYLWLGAEYCTDISIVITLSLNYYVFMMTLVNTSYRNVYGLFKKLPIVPVFMAAANILLSVVWGFKLGVWGVFLATSVSRIITIVWVDPYLLYKYVFIREKNRYIISYLGRMVITAFLCAAAYFITAGLRYSVGMLIVRLVIALTISVIAIFMGYHRTDEFKYALKLSKNLVNRLFHKVR